MMPPAPIVDELLFAGETVVFTGYREVSRLAHQAALCIASEPEFLGQKVRRGLRTVLVELELSRQAIKDQLVKMAGDDNEARGFWVWCADSCQGEYMNFTPESIHGLKRYLDQLHADVVIINSWNVWKSDGSTGNEDAIAARRLFDILRERNPELVIIVVQPLEDDYESRFEDLVDNPNAWIEPLALDFELMPYADAWIGLAKGMDSKGKEAIILRRVAKNDRTMIALKEDEDTLRFRGR